MRYSKRKLVVAGMAGLFLVSLAAWVFAPPAVAFNSLLKVLPIDHRRLLYDAYYSRLGPQQMIHLLEVRYPFCHAEAHELGKVVYAKSKTLSDALMICGTGCTDGCFHGVLEAAFGADVNRAKTDGHVELQEIKAKLPTFCDQAQAHVADVHRQGQCVHGLGHALVDTTGYQIKPALEACGALNSRPLVYNCATGVAMQYETVYGAFDLRYRPPHYPCDQYFQAYPAACYTFKGGYIAQSLGGVPQLARECEKLSGLARLGCYSGVGYAQLDDVLKHKLSLAKACRYGTTDEQMMCIDALAVPLSEFDSRALTACDVLPAVERTECQARVRGGVADLTRSYANYIN